jgi:hypothetical protein
MACAPSSEDELIQSLLSTPPRSKKLRLLSQEEELGHPNRPSVSFAASIDDWPPTQLQHDQDWFSGEKQGLNSFASCDWQATQLLDDAGQLQLDGTPALPKNSIENTVIDLTSPEQKISPSLSFAATISDWPPTQVQHSIRVAQDHLDRENQGLNSFASCDGWHATPLQDDACWLQDTQPAPSENVMEHAEFVLPSPESQPPALQGGAGEGHPVECQKAAGSSSNDAGYDLLELLMSEEPKAPAAAPIASPQKAICEPRAYRTDEEIWQQVLREEKDGPKDIEMDVLLEESKSNDINVALRAMEKLLDMGETDTAKVRMAPASSNRLQQGVLWTSLQKITSKSMEELVGMIHDEIVRTA